MISVYRTAPFRYNMIYIGWATATGAFGAMVMRKEFLDYLQEHHWPGILMTIVFSCIVPIGVFLSRNNIRAGRRDIVHGLQKLFVFAESDGKPLIIPSFELVKYKYDPEYESDDRQQIAAQWPGYYFVPVLIYICISFIGFYFSFMFRKATGEPNQFFSPQGTGGVLTYAFLGSYLWTIQYLLRRVSNFDLSPLSFFRSAFHILFGLMVVSALFHSGLLTLAGTGMIGLAFLLGMFPTAGFELLIVKFPSLRLKRVSPASRRLLEEMPLDMIQGIDPFIKFRLSEFEIEDVQNLAATNPIQIFVETPYGLYEAIDWVAQAQLLANVGAEKTAKLHELNIRTIFDLEKSLENAVLSRKVEYALLEKPANEDEKEQEIASNFDRSSEHPINSEIRLDRRVELEAIVEMIRDDLYVRRLRQIWDVIGHQLSQRPDRAKKELS